MWPFLTSSFCLKHSVSPCFSETGQISGLADAISQRYHQKLRFLCPLRYSPQPLFHPSGPWNSTCSTWPRCGKGQLGWLIGFPRSDFPYSDLGHLSLRHFGTLRPMNTVWIARVYVPNSGTLEAEADKGLCIHGSQFNVFGSSSWNLQIELLTTHPS